MNNGKIIGIFSLWIYFQSRQFCFRYNKIIPRLHVIQLSAAIGLNRILILTRIINSPLLRELFDSQENDNININHRQVVLFEC